MGAFDWERFSTSYEPGWGSDVLCARCSTQRSCDSYSPASRRPSNKRKRPG